MYALPLLLLLLWLLGLRPSWLLPLQDILPPRLGCNAPGRFTAGSCSIHCAAYLLYLTPAA